MNVSVGETIQSFLPIAAFIVFIEIPVLSIIYPLIEVLTVYPLLISLVFSLLIFAYKTWKSERTLKTVLKQAMVMFFSFWLISQISMVIATEFEYHGIVNEYSQLFKENLRAGDELNSSWVVAAKYRDEFEGTYGKNETLPNRIITRDSGFYLGFTPLFATYLTWFEGFEKLIVLQKKGNCVEFAIAIKILLKDVTGLKTRVVQMEGFDHAFPEIYWNGSWWVFDGIFTTPNRPVRADSYAGYLKENKRNVYENLYNMRDGRTGFSVLAEHGFKSVNITIVAIIDPTSSKWDDKPAKNADVEIFAVKNWYDPLVDKGKTDEDGKYNTLLRDCGDYVLVVKSSDNRFVGVLEMNGSNLEKEEIVVRLH